MPVALCRSSTIFHLIDGTSLGKLHCGSYTPVTSSTKVFPDLRNVHM